jgi:hypothetical protein
MILEKLDSKMHNGLFTELRFSYLSSPVYLDCFGYILNRNGERIIVTRDIFNCHEFPALYLPEKLDNWQNSSITFCTKEDIEKIEAENIKIVLKNYVAKEFFYKTVDFIEPQNKKFRERVNQFKKLYSYRVEQKCPKEKVIAFYEFWKGQRDRSGEVVFDEGEVAFYWALDRLERYNIKQVYVFVDSQLIGFAWGVKFSEKYWVGMDMKINYAFKGLSRFLHQERAKLFSECEEFSLGDDVKVAGVAQYKKELGPIREVEYYYILTGKKYE